MHDGIASARYPRIYISTDRCNYLADTSDFGATNSSTVNQPRFDNPYAPQRWWLGVVVSVVGRINEVNQHRARLVHDG